MQRNLNLIVILVAYTAILFVPDLCLAQSFGGSGFESKLKGLTDSLIKGILPIMSVLGLIYAALLAASGDASARGRMTVIIGASIVGFLAPMIINWLQGAVGG